MLVGRALAGLRDQNVLIIGSGNIVHNLRAVDFAKPDSGFDWAHRFDDAAREVFLDKPSSVLSLDGHPDFDKSVPTPDHYLPMLYIAGLAGDAPLNLLVDGHAAGSISMAAYTHGLEVEPTGSGAGGPAAELPEGFPTLNSNL